MLTQTIPISMTLLAGLGVLAVALSVTAGVRRAKSGVMLGHGDDVRLHAAMRAQANLIEVTPFALLLLGVLEASGLATWAIATMAVALFAARVLHAVTFVTGNGGPGIGRAISAATTTLVTLIASVLAFRQQMGA